MRYRNFLLHARVLVAITLCVLLPLLSATADAPNKGYRIHSRFWLPYEANPDTLGLFHMNREQEGSEEEIENVLDNGDDGGGGMGPGGFVEMDSEGAESVGKNSVQDSSLYGRHGRALEQYEWVGQGQFSGCIELKNNGAGVVSPQYNDLTKGQPLTVEAWFNPEKDERSTLFALVAKRQTPSAVELKRLAGGKLEVRCWGKPIGSTEKALPLSEWHHIAMRVGPGRTVMVNWVRQKIRPDVQILVDGNRIAKIKSQEVGGALEKISGVVRIGNDVRRKSGFIGRIDEIRISTGLEKFYAWNSEWTDPAGQRAIAEDWPYLRTDQDRIFTAAFEDTVQPVRAQSEKKVNLGPRAAGENRPVPEPEFEHGVHGSAIHIGTGFAMPIYGADKNLNVESGSFEFWFSPYDWDNRKKQGFHDPMEYVPLLRATCETKKGDVSDFLSCGILHKQPRNKRPPPYIRPGKWYHVVGTWNENAKKLYLNGKRMPGATAYFSKSNYKNVETLKSVFLEPIKNRRRYNNEQTLVDELRFYSRALTPVEIANAYQRFWPETELKHLPFAHSDVTMNYPLKWVKTSVELLSPRRDRVAAVHLRIFAPELKEPIGEGDMPPVHNGRSSVKIDDVPVTYGPHRVEFSFRDEAGQEIGDMSVKKKRGAPPWLHSKVGIHEDEVLPGWTPMEAEKNVVKCWGREIKFGGDGWPQKIVSQGESLLSAPIRLMMKVGEEELKLTPNAGTQVIKDVRKSVVRTEGRAKAADWSVITNIATQFDGLMKVRTMIIPGETNELDSFVLEIPLKTKEARYLGYWTGARNFRAGAWYGETPKKEGAVFQSHKLRRKRNGRLRGSFIPYLALAGDYRGLVWFAENDKGWTKSMKIPAIEVVRDQETTVLRLNIVHKKTEFREPHTFVFGLHPAPVRPFAEDWRYCSSRLNFGFVDSFSKQDLKTDGNWGSFNIYPQDYDWEAARGRVRMHEYHYNNMRGYHGPYLYIDRNWVGLPPNTWEYRGIWYKSGFFRYYPESTNCYIWHMDQWMKNDCLHGIYIDDAWIGTFKDPQRGPAYLMSDGEMQPGFEFFDYHEFMKRLRWTFIDNGLRPRIWVHMTQTHFVPCLSFADFILDGEGRFLGWGDKRDFIRMWGMARFRFSNPKKWGLAQVWMNKIGADQDKPVEMPHWIYRQKRSYQAALLAHDIFNVGGILKDAEKAGCYSDRSKFIGYWEPNSPIESEVNQFVGSIYKQEDRTALVVVNTKKDEAIAALKLDPTTIVNGAETVKDLKVEDADTYNPPEGEDITKVKDPGDPLNGGMESKEEGVAAGFEDLLAEEERREREKERVGFLYDGHNFQWEDGILKLKVKGHDYRLLIIRGLPQVDETGEDNLLLP
ncbi:MAG: glycoside hydrolase domain-containing protein [Candidatus Brocadiia bacterium]